jgi:hypothetical protein
MKTTKIFFALIAFMGLLVFSCSDNNVSPVSPTDQAAVTSFDKKGPVINSVTGSAQISYDGKVIVNMMNATEYKDGTFGGQYEINMQGVFQAHEHGEVMFLKVYYDVPDYGTVAIIGGQVKSSNVPGQEGLYECYLVIDNGTQADMINWWIPYITTIEQAQEYWDISPLEFINGFDTSWGTRWNGANLVECEIGNIQIH